MKWILIALMFTPQIVVTNGNVWDTEDPSEKNSIMAVAEENEVIINMPVYYTSNNTLPYAVRIVSGGVLSIIATTTMTGSGLITVCDGGILSISGTLANANIVLQSGAQLLVSSGGKVNLASGKTLEAPSGAKVDITNGEVNNY